MRNIRFHNHSKIKAGIACLLLVVVLAPITKDITLNRVNAFFGGLTTSYEVFSADTIAQTAADSAAYGTQAIGVAAEGSQELKESVLDAIVWRLTKKAVSNMVKSTTEWVRNGFKSCEYNYETGEEDCESAPMFVTNMDKFLLNVADETAGEFINGSPLSALCSPFELQVRGALEFEYGLSRANDIPVCTLSGVVDNLENFGINTGETAANWNTWLEMSVNQNNNPYGAYVNAKSSLEAKIVDAEGNETKLLEFGGGYFSSKECTELPDGTEHCEVVTPGQTIASQLNDQLGLGADSLVQADEIGELVDVLIGTVAESVLTKAGGLAGYSPPPDSETILDEDEYNDLASEYDNPIDNANLQVLNNYDKLIAKQEEAYKIYSDVLDSLNQCTRVTVIYTCTKETSSGSRRERTCTAETVPTYTLVEENDRDDEELIDESPVYNLLGIDYKNAVDELTNLNSILERLHQGRATAENATTISEVQLANQTYQGWVDSPALYDRIDIGEAEDYQLNLDTDINDTCLPLPTDELRNQTGNETTNTDADIPPGGTDITDIDTDFPEPGDIGGAGTSGTGGTSGPSGNGSASAESTNWEVEYTINYRITNPGAPNIPFFPEPITDDDFDIQYIDSANASVSLFSDMIEDITITLSTPDDTLTTRIEITPKTDAAKTEDFGSLVQETVDQLSFEIEQEFTGSGPTIGDESLEDTTLIVEPK